MIKKIFTAGILALALTFCAAYAAEPKIDYSVTDISGGSLTVNGTIPYSINKEWVTIVVLNPNANVSDGINSVNCMKQTRLVKGNSDNADGTFSAGIQLKNPQAGAKYKILVNYYGAQAPLEKTMTYYDENTLSQRCKDIVEARNAKNEEELVALFDDDILSLLGVRKNIVGQVSVNAVSKALISKDKISMTNDSVRKAYEEAANLVILSSDGAPDYILGLKGTNKDEVLDVLKGGYKNTAAYEAFEYADRSIAEDIARSVKADYSNGEEFNKSFEFEVLSRSLKNSKSYLDVRKIMNTYKDVFETSWEAAYNSLASDKKAAAETALADAVKTEKLNTTEDIGKKFLSLINKQMKPDDNKYTGGSRGGSSGGGGSYSNVKVDSGLVKETQSDSTVDTSLPFVDLQNVPWAVESIKALSDKGVISGRSKLIFEPDSYVTREEFVKMTVLAFGITSDNAEACRFEDVLKNDWFCDVVTTGVNTGIIKGINDKFFGSGMNVTRQDAAVILCRAAEYKSIQLNSDGEKRIFNDSADISDYAKEAVNRLSAVGAVNGDENGNFMPFGNTTRAEAAKLIYSLTAAE